MVDPHFEDRAILRELIQNWVVWRDTAQWDEFRKVWHEDGRMVASWKQAPFEEFIAASRAGMERGNDILHLLGGSAIKVQGNRAISQTKMEIMQRAFLDGVHCDVSCIARHYDFWEKRPDPTSPDLTSPDRSGPDRVGPDSVGPDRWGLVLRETIFDKATLSPVELGAQISIDHALFDQFPAQYAALAYLQEKAGYTVRRDMPHGWRGPSVEALYRRGEAWLTGQLSKAWDTA